MAFCRNCGNKLNDGDTVCANCGNEVKAKPDFTQEVSTLDLQDSQAAIHTNKKRPIIIICLVLGFLIIAGVVLLLVFGGKSKDSEESNDSNKSKQYNLAETIYQEIKTYCTEKEASGYSIDDGIYRSEDGGELITDINKKLEIKDKWQVSISDNSPDIVFVYESECYAAQVDSSHTNARNILVAASTAYTRMETMGSPISDGVYGSWQRIKAKDESYETDSLFKKTPLEERQEVLDLIESSMGSIDNNWCVYIFGGEPICAIEYYDVYPNNENFKVN